MHASRVLLAVGTVLLLMACGGSDSVTPPPGGNGNGNGNGSGEPVASASVVAGSSSNSFTPSTVDLLVDGTVTWTFGSLAHNVIFQTASGAPDDIPATTNADVSRTFGTAGTFGYDCTIHPGMSGVIQVH